MAKKKAKKKGKRGGGYWRTSSTGRHLEPNVPPPLTKRVSPPKK